MIIVGYHGRKGPKEYLYFIRDFTIMGSNTYNYVYNTKIPIMIVKNYIERA